MKFWLSLVAIGLFFVLARYIGDVYFPGHEFLVGWIAGSTAMVINAAIGD